LVAPVTREGATSWPVYLPEGTWYDFWTQARYDGPCGVTVDAPLDRLPLFVRAGAILPLGPVMPHTEARPLDEVTLLTYPGGSAHFVLYEDDGHTNAYRHGGSARTRITCAVDASGHTIELDIAPPDGDASLVPPGRSYLWQVLAARPRRVIMEHGEEIPQRDGATAGAAWWHDGAHFLFVRTPALASHVTVEMAHAQV
jgi:alpha-glucosidase